MSRINYLAKSLGAQEWDPGLYCPDGAFIDHKNYRDPDAVCKELYVDLRLMFLELAHRSNLPGFLNFKLSGPRRNGSLELVEDSPVGRARYSSDFIGPSRAWAKAAKMECEAIGDYLEWARELGGHIMWCKHACSINQAKGGKPLYDRMDLTLLELQDYMRNPLVDPTQHLCKKALRRAFASDAAWFARFKPHAECTPAEWFTSFISFWKLESFVNNNGDPMSMVLNTPDDVRNRSGKAVSSIEVAYTSAEEQEFLLHYKHYVTNMKIAVEARTNIMVAILEQARKHNVE